METPGVQIFSIALSPKDQEPRRLYLGKYKSNELYSISAAALRSGTQTANPELIANWTGVPYRMVMDKHGFFNKNYIHSWNGSRPFQELRSMDLIFLANYFCHGPKWKFMDHGVE
ncbi:Hypothetical predicted protein [Cloeon dipterum]|uniref:Uncharacterized protein n=1 Tax=Cloeon dipterum TaxID=197152 RepID=A0A8S1DEE5_9INSE|nr:Hypothetical predicted protein [Cloeon dipterum]